MDFLKNKDGVMVPGHAHPVYPSMWAGDKGFTLDKALRRYEQGLTLKEQVAEDLEGKAGALRTRVAQRLAKEAREEARREAKERARALKRLPTGETMATKDLPTPTLKALRKYDTPLARLMLTLGISLSDMGRMAGVNHTSILRMLKNNRPPSARNLGRFLGALSEKAGEQVETEDLWPGQQIHGMRCGRMAAVPDRRCKR